MAHAPSLAEQVADVEAALTYLQKQERFRGQEQLLADVQAHLALLKWTQTREGVEAGRGRLMDASDAPVGQGLSLKPRPAS
jgi:hypothetical protein